MEGLCLFHCTSKTKSDSVFVCLFVCFAGVEGGGVGVLQWLAIVKSKMLYIEHLYINVYVSFIFLISIFMQFHEIVLFCYVFCGILFFYLFFFFGGGGWDMWVLSLSTFFQSCRDVILCSCVETGLSRG